MKKNNKMIWSDDGKVAHMEEFPEVKERRNELRRKRARETQTRREQEYDELLRLRERVAELEKDRTSGLNILQRIFGTSLHTEDSIVQANIDVLHAHTDEELQALKFNVDKVQELLALQLSVREAKRTLNATLGMCLICDEGKADTALAPCGHHAFCHECVPKLKNGRCPLCRAEIVMQVKLV